MSILLVTALRLVSGGLLLPDTHVALDRYLISRVVDINNLFLHKDVPETSIVMNMAAGDSIKIDCPTCSLLSNTPSGKGIVSVLVLRADGEEEISSHMFGKWMRGTNGAGKLAVAIRRDGYGERIIELKNLIVYKKSSQQASMKAGERYGLLHVSNLYLKPVDPVTNLNQTTFWLRLKEEDQYFVKVAGANISGSLPILGNIFKSGEEFAKEPMVFEQAKSLPALGSSNALFGFEFSEASAGKGLNIYHLDIERIPLHSSGAASTLGK